MSTASGWKPRFTGGCFSIVELSTCFQLRRSQPRFLTGLPLTDKLNKFFAVEFIQETIVVEVIPCRWINRASCAIKVANRDVCFVDFFARICFSEIAEIDVCCEEFVHGLIYGGGDEGWRRFDRSLKRSPQSTQAVKPAETEREGLGQVTRRADKDGHKPGHDQRGEE